MFSHQLKAVGHDRHELDHLDRGHVLFPPDVLLVFRSQGGQEVVGVHQDVDERVLEQQEFLRGGWEVQRMAQATHTKAEKGGVAAGVESSA